MIKKQKKNKKTRGLEGAKIITRIWFNNSCWTIILTVITRWYESSINFNYSYYVNNNIKANTDIFSVTIIRLPILRPCNAPWKRRHCNILVASAAFATSAILLIPMYHPFCSLASWCPSGYWIILLLLAVSCAGGLGRRNLSRLLCCLSFPRATRVRVSKEVCELKRGWD